MIRCNGCNEEFDYDVTRDPPVGHGHIEVVSNPAHRSIIKQTDYYCSLTCLREYSGVAVSEGMQ